MSEDTHEIEDNGEASIADYPETEDERRDREAAEFEARRQSRRVNVVDGVRDTKSR
jgi:hypothetical protein